MYDRRHVCMIVQSLSSSLWPVFANFRCECEKVISVARMHVLTTDPQEKVRVRFNRRNLNQTIKTIGG